jgi:hypothetical protein
MQCLGDIVTFKQYNVTQARDQRFYAVTLARPFIHNGKSFYRIVGAVCGYTHVNAAWQRVLEEQAGMAQLELWDIDENDSRC